MPPLAPILIPAIGDALGSVFNFSSQARNSREMAQVARENTDKTIAANKEQSALAYQRDLEQWHRSNAYNDPSAQMARMKSAGLNPMLAYGSGNVGGLSSASSPSYTPARTDYNYQATQIPQIQVPDMVSRYQDVSLKQAQIDNVKANTRSTQQETINKTTIDLINNVEYLFKEREKQAGLTKAQVEADFAFRQQMYDMLQKKLNVTGSELDNYIKNQTKDYQIDSARLGNISLEKQIDEAKERLKGYSLTRKLQAAQIDSSNASAFATNQQGAKTEAERFFQEMENEMAKEGRTFSDPWYVRDIKRDLSATKTERGTDEERMNRLMDFLRKLLLGSDQK